MVEGHGSLLVARLGCGDCWSCVGSFFCLVDSSALLVAFQQSKAMAAFAVWVNEDPARSSLGSEALPAYGSYHAASDNSTDLTPQPSPWRRLGWPRYHNLVACLQGQRIEDMPSFGASDWIAVGADSEFALGRAGWEMLDSDVVVACGTEAQSER